MIGHVIGSYPTNYFNSSAYGTSLAVVQFFAFVTGAAPVHKPDNGFRTVSLVGEERYCLGCIGVRWHDVVYGEMAEGSRQKAVGSRQKAAVRIARCRCCEKVGAV